MHGAFHVDALYALQRGCVDHIHRARRLSDRYVHALSIFAGGDIVRVAAQLDLVRYLECLSVDNIERAFRFIADI